MKLSLLSHLFLCMGTLTLGQEALPAERLEITGLRTGESALCWETNSIDVSFTPGKTSLLVDYRDLRFGFFPTSGRCNFGLNFRNMPLGWRFRFGNATWRGHAKFTQGHSIREMYASASLNYEKWTETDLLDKETGQKIWLWMVDSNNTVLTQWGPKVTWGKNGDFDDDFEISAGILFPPSRWSPCVTSEIDRIRWGMAIGVQAFITQNFDLMEGDAVFGRPAPAPALTQEIGLEWERCGK